MIFFNKHSCMSCAHAQSVLERRFDSTAAIYHLLVETRRKNATAAGCSLRAVETMDMDHVSNDNPSPDSTPPDNVIDPAGAEELLLLQVY
jgi:hypothetical protein